MYNALSIWSDVWYKYSPSTSIVRIQAQYGIKLHERCHRYGSFQSSLVSMYILIAISIQALNLYWIESTTPECRRSLAGQTVSDMAQEAILLLPRT